MHRGLVKASCKASPIPLIAAYPLTAVLPNSATACSCGHWPVRAVENTSFKLDPKATKLISMVDAGQKPISACQRQVDPTVPQESRIQLLSIDPTRSNMSYDGHDTLQGCNLCVHQLRLLAPAKLACVARATGCTKTVGITKQWSSAGGLQLRKSSCKSYGLEEVLCDCIDSSYKARF
jgi:hypothetical protein